MVQERVYGFSGSAADRIVRTVEQTEDTARNPRQSRRPQGANVSLQPVDLVAIVNGTPLANGYYDGRLYFWDPTGAVGGGPPTGLTLLNTAWTTMLSTVLTQGSTAITFPNNDGASLIAGMSITSSSGQGIPAGTTITGPSAGAATLSQAATISETVNCYFTGPQVFVMALGGPKPQQYYLARFTGMDPATGKPIFETGSAFFSPLTTKGDVWGFSNADTRVPVGADGTVLTADSTSTNGVSYFSFATGVSGSDFNITHSPTIFTFNLPPADYAVLGKISLVDQYVGAGVKRFDAVSLNRNQNLSSGQSPLLKCTYNVTSQVCAPSGWTISGNDSGLLLGAGPAGNGGFLHLFTFGTSYTPTSPNYGLGVSMYAGSLNVNSQEDFVLAANVSGTLSFLLSILADATSGNKFRVGASSVGSRQWCVTIYSVSAAGYVDGLTGNLGPGCAATGGIITNLGSGSFGGSGTVTSITAGTGLTGGTITTSGTIALSVPVSIANGGTNSTTALTNNQVMVSSSGAIVELGAMTNGQIVIGSTGTTPTIATITAGTGITVTNGTGSITIAASGQAPAGTVARCTADVSTTSISFANVTGLSFSIGANEIWQVEFYLALTGSVGGMKFQLTGPASPNDLNIQFFGNTGAANSFTADWQTAFSTPSNGVYSQGSFSGIVKISACINNGVNAGTVQLQFAAQTASQTNIVKKDSYLTARKM